MIIALILLIFVGPNQIINGDYDFSFYRQTRFKVNMTYDPEITSAYFKYNDFEGFQGFYFWAQEKVDPSYIPGKTDAKRIIVNFTVSKMGGIHRIKVKGVKGYYVHKIKRVLKSSPTWQPATKAGNEIEMLFIMPLYVNIKVKDKLE